MDKQNSLSLLTEMGGELALSFLSIGRVSQILLVHPLVFVSKIHSLIICALFLALYYPFVLAFEPNFVEIRHVETGRIVQVIQGHNLRALFASTTQTLPPQPTLTYNTQSSYSIPQPQPYGGRDSIYSQFGTSSQYSSGTVNQSQQFVKGQNANRDEIIMVSDDSVLNLRLIPKPLP